jgi:phenol/toluene 2-monooxygenase (NADH) P1/A1
VQIDLRTVAIKPQRHTFDHIARRFGDKPASRYQEGTYDIQATHNLQYIPTWDPDHELHDASRTRVVMGDWYALRDPRQFYYGTYTITRARQQEGVENSFDFVETRGLAGLLPSEVKQTALELLLPLRHVGWGANLNNLAMCAYGYGTAITQPCCYHAADNLGIAQYLTRIGLLLDDAPALDAAKEAWMTAPRWQPLRRLMENLLVRKDWFEVFVAQNLVLDGLLYPLVYENIVDKRLTARSGAPVAMLTAFMTEWFAETSKWVDFSVKTAAAESPANQVLIAGWTTAWRDRAVAALTPIIENAIGADAAPLIASVADQFNARAGKLGLTI